MHFWRAASATAISLGSVFLFKRFQGAHSALPQFNDLLRDKRGVLLSAQANVSSNASDFANGFRPKAWPARKARIRADLPMPYLSAKITSTKVLQCN